jgi:chromosome segregation ATPase
MSELESVKKENEGLKQQLAQNGRGVEGLLAQLDAAKQVIQEHINNSLGLRTNLILFDKQTKQLNAHIENSNKQIASLNQQLADATKKIEELTPKKEEVAEPVVDPANNC